MKFFVFIKEKLRLASIVDQFIYINLFVFILVVAVNSFGYLQNNHVANFMIDYFALSIKSSNIFYKPYTLISYSFLHVNFIHLLMNLIALYYIGNLFINYFSSKRFITYYILGGIFGGIFFLLSFNYFPVFKTSNGILIGASASISAILVGLATYIPNYKLNLRLIGSVKLWILTALFILLSIVLIPNGNAGGQLAHLGGAFIGFLLTKYFSQQKTKQTNLKTVYKNINTIKVKNDFGLSNHQKQKIQQRKIDTLLDKISKSGYDSLTKKERVFLASVGQK